MFTQEQYQRLAHFTQNPPVWEGNDARFVLEMLMQALSEIHLLEARLRAVEIVVKRQEGDNR